MKTIKIFIKINSILLGLWIIAILLMPIMTIFDKKIPVNLSENFSIGLMLLNLVARSFGIFGLYFGIINRKSDDLAIRKLSRKLLVISGIITTISIIFYIFIKFIIPSIYGEY